MKKEYLLNLDSLTDLNNFVKEISMQISCDVDAIYQRQIVDAKSYLGLVTISIHPVLIRINTEDEEQIRVFGEICRKYEIKEQERIMDYNKIIEMDNVTLNDCLEAYKYRGLSVIINDGRLVNFIGNDMEESRDACFNR